MFQDVKLITLAADKFQMTFLIIFVDPGLSFNIFFSRTRIDIPTFSRAYDRHIMTSRSTAALLFTIFYNVILSKTFKRVVSLPLVTEVVSEQDLPGKD